MNKRALIVTGGTLTKQFFQSMIQTPYDLRIAVDSGSSYFIDLNIQADYYLGDFDSIDKRDYLKIQMLDKPIEAFQAEKELTDTHIALLKCHTLGYHLVDVIGGIGSRMDHTLANIHLLEWGIENQLQITLIDEHNRICLCVDNKKIERNGFKYISLLPISKEVSGVTTDGMKYPLHDATLYRDDSRGISNEIIGEKGSVTLSKGKLLIVQSVD